MNPYAVNASAIVGCDNNTPLLMPAGEGFDLLFMKQSRPGRVILLKISGKCGLRLPWRESTV